MSQVFISHSSKDIERVNNLCELFEQNGINYWVSSKHIREGENWDKSINAALQKASCVVIVLSQNSLESDYVTAEWQYALNEKKQVFPVRIENIALPPRLHILQAIDWFLSPEEDEKIKALCSRLPQTHIAIFQNLIETTASQQELKQFFLDNPRVLSLVLGISSENHNIGYDFTLETYTFSGASISPWIYICSLNTPFQDDGTISSEIDMRLQSTKVFFENSKELLEVREARLRIYIFAGRYDHYQYSHKIQFEQQWQLEYPFLNITLTSYDQVLKKVQSGLGFLDLSE